MNELFRVILHLPVQGTRMAAEFDAFHYVVISVTMLGAFGIAALTAWYLLRHRRGREQHGRVTSRSVPQWLEVLVIVSLLSLFLGFWVVGFRQYVRLRTPPPGALEIYVVAKQWMWAFAYPDGLTTTEDLFVRVGQPVKLVLTSRDVIHSFFVPEFRIKQDVVPGRATEIWFDAEKPGQYQILCAEYCGLSHSYMRGRVFALSDTDYQAWREARARGPVPRADARGATSEQSTEGRSSVSGVESGARLTSLASIGERVAAERGCLRCHTVDGTPHLGPTWAGLYGATIPLEDKTSIVADDAYLTQSMMDPLAHVHEGFAPIMPTYIGLITASETAAILAFIRSLSTTVLADVRRTPLSREATVPIKLPSQASTAPAAPESPSMRSAPLSPASEDTTP